MNSQTLLPATTRKKPKLWVPLLWATIPTAIVSSFGCMLDQLPEQVIGAVFFALFLPTILICETLGFGQFNIFGGSTISPWIFYSVMVAFLYLYCLIFTLLVRLTIRLTKPLLKRPQTNHSPVHSAHSVH